MKGRLRILHLEDDPNDAELVGATLADAGIDSEIRLVATREDFTTALKDGGFDLILADLALPAFDGMTALAIVREMQPDLPFIFVSGKLGEEAAIESLKSGATDYVLKNRLSRLAPAVTRAMSEAEERAERRQGGRGAGKGQQRDTGNGGALSKPLHQHPRRHCRDRS